MPGNQTHIGKAFEYAVLNAIYTTLKDTQSVELTDTAALNTAGAFYKSINKADKDKMDKGAYAAIKTILNLEPQLTNPMDNQPLIISIQTDALGRLGDVRDILTMRRQNNWEIGISCKHNHKAVKHNRLSQTIDFGAEWLGHPCSQQYFEELTPLFNKLKIYESKGVKWEDVPNKRGEFYVPLLNAFMSELNRINSEELKTPQRLVQYLLGHHDFYKVMSDEIHQLTTVQVFNIYGTLNRSSGCIPPRIKTKPLAMPTKFYNIDFKQNSDTTIIVACDNGWEISMRIHSAKKIVEPSLKFDITLKGIPAAMYTHTEPWE